MSDQMNPYLYGSYQVAWSSGWRWNLTTCAPRSNCRWKMELFYAVLGVFDVALIVGLAKLARQ